MRSGCSPMRRWIAALALIAGLSAAPAGAHERSESSSHWHYAHQALSGVLTVRTREVTRLMIPGDQEDALPRIWLAHVARTVSAAVDGRECTPAPPSLLHAEAGYLRAAVQLRCPPGERLRLKVGVLLGVAPSHHHFLYIEAGAGTAREAILTIANPALELELGGRSSRALRFADFVRMGIEHIATGADHLAFLLALLVTARSRREILLVVTGFTLGHSVTLSLAALGIVQAERAAVESLIGLTIALAAARNLIADEREGRMAAAGAALIAAALLIVPSSARPQMPAPLILAIALLAASWLWLASLREGAASVRSRVTMAAGFGLVHGIGFASALQDLALPRALLLPTLLGFNLGVELGQLAAVGCALVLVRALTARLPALRSSESPAVIVSAALVSIGTAWFLIRATTFA